MKPNFVLIFCLSCLFFATNEIISQPIPLLKPENRWSLLNRKEPFGAHPTYIGTSLQTQWLKVGEDTVIDKRNYKIIMVSTDEHHQNWQKDIYLERKGLLLREELGRVYQYQGNEIGESILYDFNLQKGDSITRIVGPFNLISKVNLVRDTIIDNLPRKILHISNYVNGMDGVVGKPEIWIEGMGSLCGFFREKMVCYATGPDLDESNHLLCFFQEDKHVYHNTEFSDCYYQQWFTGVQTIEEADFKIFPNPSSGIFTIQMETNNINSLVRIYDINGKLLKFAQTDLSGRLEVDLTGYHKGIYLVRIEKQGVPITKKLIIK